MRRTWISRAVTFVAVLEAIAGVVMIVIGQARENAADIVVFSAVGFFCFAMAAVTASVIDQ